MSRKAGGAGGIRTLDTLLTYTHFPGERLRPLGHRSACTGRRALAFDWVFRKRCGVAGNGYVGGMTRTFGTAPGLAEIEALALAALARLPEAFRVHLDGVAVLVEDFADEETLAAMGIADPFELTGIYEGVPVGERHSAPSGTLPDRIRLFRSPILDEWIARGDETLEHLVAHVLIHEVGHHFGLSDADIEALEQQG